MVTAALLFSEDLKMLTTCALRICPGKEEVDGETGTWAWREAGSTGWTGSLGVGHLADRILRFHIRTLEAVWAQGKLGWLMGFRAPTHPGFTAGILNSVPPPLQVSSDIE